MGTRSRVSQQLMVLCISASRGFHSSATALGGRYTTQTPEKQKRWRENLSKKAKQRLKRQRDTTLRRTKAMPQYLSRKEANSTSALAVTEGKALAPAPSKAELALQSQANRTVIESVTLLEETPVRAVEELLRVNPDAFRATLSPRPSSSPSSSSQEGHRWNTYLRILGAHGRVVDAVQAFRDMKRAGFAVSAYTLSAVLSAAGQQRNAGVAEQVWAALTGHPAPAAPAPGSAPQYGSREGYVTPTAHCFGALMQAYVRSMDLPAAFRVLSAAEGAGVDMSNPVLWTHLIVGCVHAGEYEKAVDTFEQMRTFHCLPDAVAYTAVINAAGKTDNVERVLDLLAEMRQMGIYPTAVTYNAAVHAAGRSLRRYAHAHDLFWEMDALGMARDVRTYHGALLACSHTGDVARAREYMAHMIGKGIKPDLVCLNTVLTVYTRSLRDAARPVQSGRKALGAVTTDQFAAIRADGRELPMLETMGALSKDPAVVKEAEYRLDEDPVARAIGKKSRELRYGSARRVLGSTDDLVDAMLADYFGAGDDHPANRDEDLDAVESGAGPESDVYAGPEHEEILNPQDPAWMKMKAALLNTRLVSPDLLEDIEEEFSTRPAMTDAEEAARAAYFEERHKLRMARLESELVDIASEEAALKGAGQGLALVQTATNPTPGSDSEFDDEDLAIDVKPASPRSDLVGLGGVFSDVLEHAEAVSGRKAVGVSVATPVVPAPHPPSSSEIILHAAQNGSRVPMRNYLAALEREVMEGSLGREWAYESADEEDAVMAMKTRASARALAEKDRLEEEEAEAAELGLPREVEAVVEGEPVRPLLPPPELTSASIPRVDALPTEAVESSLPAVRTREGKVYLLRRRWMSMFSQPGDADEDSATLGGVRLKELFDVNTIPLPPEWERRLAKGAAKGDVEMDDLDSLDVGDIYEHTEAVLRARIQAALLREAMGVTGRVSPTSPLLRSQAKRLVDRMAEQRTMFDDPIMSENAEEYAAIAGVRLPVGFQEEEEGQEGGRDGRSGVAGGGGGSEEDVDAGDEANDPEYRLKKEAFMALRELGGYDRAHGVVSPGETARRTAGVTVEGGRAGGGLSAGPPVLMPTRPGEEVLLASLADAGPVRNTDVLESAMADDPDGLAPVQRSHRAFTARVLSRVLAAHPIGPVELALVAATESAGKHRQRSHLDQVPSLLDALFAVQRLKLDAAGGSGKRYAESTVVASTRQQQAEPPRRVVDATVLGSAPPSPADMSAESTAVGVLSSPPLPPSAPPLSPFDSTMLQAETAAGAMRASPAVQARAAARHEARRAEAKQVLAETASNVPVVAARLQGLADLSNKLLGGAAWLPSAPYPVDRGQRKQVLLTEVGRIYRREFPACGLVPDKVTLNVMLSAYACSGDASSAYAFLHDQFPAAGVSPDTRTFKALIKMHVVKKQGDRAVELLRTMKDLALSPDADCYGLAVHARAREWRVKEAILLVQEARAAGLVCPEEYAKLLRQRCKALGIFHKDVPEHPIGWQFRPEVMAKRFAGAKSKATRRETAFLKPKRRGNMS